MSSLIEIVTKYNLDHFNDKVSFPVQIFSIGCFVFFSVSLNFMDVKTDVLASPVQNKQTNKCLAIYMIGIDIYKKVLGGMVKVFPFTKPVVCENQNLRLGMTCMLL